MQLRRNVWCWTFGEEKSSYGPRLTNLVCEFMSLAFIFPQLVSCVQPGVLINMMLILYTCLQIFCLEGPTGQIHPKRVTQNIGRKKWGPYGPEVIMHYHPGGPAPRTDSDLNNCLESKNKGFHLTQKEGAFLPRQAGQALTNKICPSESLIPRC